MKYSFIVSCYNEEKYIERCLKSIINQPCNNFEVIVINDGSTDNSAHVIENTLKNFKNNKIIEQKNSGLSASRNLGIKNAIGEYIIFVDGDDYLDQNYINEIDSSIDPGLEILKYNFRYVFDKKVDEQKTVYKNTIYSGEEALHILINDKIVFEPAVIYIFKRSFLEKIEFKFEVDRYHEDFGVIPITILLARSIKLTNLCLYNYVQTDNSITRTSDSFKIAKRANDIMWFYEQNIQKLNSVTCSEVVKKEFISYMSNSVIMVYNKLDGNEKREYRNRMVQNKVVSNLAKDSFLQKIKRIIMRIRIGAWNG